MLTGTIGAALVAAPFSVAAQAAPQIKLKAAAAKLPEEFTSILSVRELADGRVLVADVTETRVSVADFVAGTVTQIGRNGQGPGEYQTPGFLRPIGSDSTLMVERRGSRWHLFHGAKLVASVPLDNSAVVATNGQAIGADGRGNVIRTVSFINESKLPDAPPDSAALVRANRRTSRLDTLARVKNAKSIMSTTTNARGEIQSVSIVRPPFAVGEEVALFEDGWVAVARVEPYRVDWIAPDGKMTRGERLPWLPVRVTEADVTAYLRARSRGLVTPQSAELLRRQVETSMPNVPPMLPPTMPAGLMPMDDGRLLVRHPETAASPLARYDIVDRRGTLAATIALGKGESIVAISRKWAYVVMTDDDGLQFLRRHPWP